MYAISPSVSAQHIANGPNREAEQGQILRAQPKPMRLQGQMKMQPCVVGQHLQHEQHMLQRHLQLQHVQQGSLETATQQSR